MEDIISVSRMTRDIRNAAKTLGDAEVRYLVDAYYAQQEMRIGNSARARELEKAGEPNAIFTWLAEQEAVLEQQIKGALDRYTRHHAMGSWMRKVHGIGPIISAGILAHIDIEQCPTVGHINSFAGLAPDKRWQKGERRPWNARLKTLCWHAGQCFKRFSGDEKCFYGHLYIDRKKLEVERNEKGDFAPLAAQTLKERTFYDKELKAGYESGKLPAGRLDLRATRWATKIFLEHMFVEWYTIHHGRPPPKVYPIAILGHAHYIEAPKH